MRHGRVPGVAWVAAGMLMGSCMLSACLWAQANDPPPSDPIELMRRRNAKQEQAGAQAQPGAAFNRFTGMNVPVDSEQQQKLHDQLMDEQILAGIHKGVDFLIPEVQKLIAQSATTGDVDANQSVGRVAVGVYALLQVGRSTNDPRLRFSSPDMRLAVDWLLKVHTERTYSAALQASALSLLPPRPEFRKELTRVKQQIVDAILNNGAYGYEVASVATRKVTRIPVAAMAGENWWDNSNSQYALLGVWSAAEADVDVEQRFWRLTDAHWRNDQLPDGGWCYHTTRYRTLASEFQATETMTVAGVASLYVTMDRLGVPLRLDPMPDKVLENGLARVAADFRKRSQNLASDLYYAYGVERVGLASGLRYFEGIDWYRQGAAALLLGQAGDGSWEYDGQAVGTAYALLFLVHGRNPVAFNKLKYSGTWNARPRDDANLTRWLGKQIERPLNWQIVDIDSPAEDWLSAPVLLITGHKDPQFRPEEIAKFRQYVQAGGLIFSTADGDDKGFTAGIKLAMAATFDRKYEPRELPSDHLLYQLDFKLAKAPSLIGLSNGLREVWIHSPADLGAAWQQRNAGKADAFNIAGNLYLYAVGKQTLVSRLKTTAVASAAVAPERRIVLGRLQYSGNWDPEPSAWPRLAKLLAHEKIELQLPTVPVAELNSATIPLVHITGSTKFSFSEESRARIKQFLDGGGTLLADAAGSSDPFAASLLETLKEIYPDGQMEIVDPNGPMFDGSVPGASKIDRVDYRSVNRKDAWERQPDMIGLKRNGRWVVLFSQPDITSGLLGTNTWGIAGYKSESAAAVARNILLFLDEQYKKRAAMP